MANKKESLAIDFWEHQRKWEAEGYQAVCGIDEAGRGPLCGPVVAAAVILPMGAEIPGLNDSKKLSEKKREALYDVILEKALAWHVSFVDEKVIDEINILNATFQAMHQAVDGLQIPADFALVDGNRAKGFSIPTECVVGGDGKAACIAAASILAKVSRDRFMIKMAEKYPEYGFEKHKGYGTKAHYQALETYGVCPIHRKTFLKKFFQSHE